MEGLQCYETEDQESEADRVILNVGGVRFETYVTTLQNIADTRLAWIIENVEEENLRQREFFFDRHPAAFVHILNFYRTGKLHTPTDMCGPAFEEELQFWGIDEKQMEPCCWETFTKHREAEDNLKTFEGPGFEDLQVTRSRKYSNFSTFEDESFMKRNMNAIWALLNDPHSSDLAKRFSLLSCGMIIISLSVYCLLTMPLLKNDSILTWINQICLTFFTIEFILRVIVCPRKRQFIKDYQNWIDILSIIPSYLVLAFPNRQWIYNLVIIRLLRVFKFFKLSYGLQVLLHTLKASSYELTLLLLILLIPLVVFSSLVYAFEHGMTDGQTDFDSIPRTFWWAIVTMTTVGYGDLAPKTWVGQLIGSICAIISVLIIALPISVIGNNFNLYYAHVRARLKLPKKNRHLLQGRLRGLLRQPAMLSSRDRDRKNITRRNNGNVPTLPINTCDSNNGRLTVDRAQTSSPFIQLRRRGAAGLDQVSLDTDTDKNSTDSRKGSGDSTDQGSVLSKDILLPLAADVMHDDENRDSLVASLAEDCSPQSENRNSLILNQFLTHSIDERGNSPPSPRPDSSQQRRKSSLSSRADSNEKRRKGSMSPRLDYNERRRKKHIQENVMNGFPTRARRAAVGLSLEDNSRYSSSGSSSSLVLPPVTPIASRQFEYNAAIPPEKTGCNNNRRISMRKMESFESQPHTDTSQTGSSAGEACISRSNTYDSSLSKDSHSQTPTGRRSRSSLASMDRCPSLQTLDDNANDVAHMQKISRDRNITCPKLAFGLNHVRILKRSHTDTNFVLYSSNGKTNGGGGKSNLRNHHSWSIDDILRNKVYDSDVDETCLFLKESGV